MVGNNMVVTVMGLTESPSRCILSGVTLCYGCEGKFGDLIPIKYTIRKEKNTIL